MQGLEVEINHPDGTTSRLRDQGKPQYAVVIGPVVEFDAYIDHLESVAQSDDNAASDYLEAAHTPHVDFITRGGRTVPALSIPGRGQHIAMTNHPVIDVLKSRAREYAHVCRASAKQYREEIATLQAGKHEPVGGYDVYAWCHSAEDARTAAARIDHLTEIGIQVSIEPVEYRETAPAASLTAASTS